MKIGGILRNHIHTYVTLISIFSHKNVLGRAIIVRGTKGWEEKAAVVNVQVMLKTGWNVDDYAMVTKNANFGTTTKMGGVFCIVAVK